MSTKHLYTTDGRVRHYSKEEDVNKKLGRIIGARFVEYRRQWSAVNRLDLITEFPLFLQLDMNQNCNLKCRHCVKSRPDLMAKIYAKDALAWEDYKNIIHEGQEYGCPSLSPCGINEPLLMKELEKYIKYAHDHGFIDIMMNTNGTLLTEERSKKLLDAGLTRIRFSIDAATSETYSKIRKGSDYLELVKNIERFLELKELNGYDLPVTGANFCKISINEHEADAFIKYWEQKVDIVTIQTFVPLVSGGGYAKYYPSDQVDARSKLTNFKCPQPFQRLLIRNYDVTPCCALDSRLKIGDLRKDSLYKIWNSKAIRQLRELHKNGEYFKSVICKKCVNLFYPQK